MYLIIEFQMPFFIDLYKFNHENRYNVVDLSKGYEKITLYKILLITSFSAFLPNFGKISAKCRIRQSVVSAKCLFGKVVFGEVSRTPKRVLTGQK